MNFLTAEPIKSEEFKCFVTDNSYTVGEGNYTEYPLAMEEDFEYTSVATGHTQNTLWEICNETSS